MLWKGGVACVSVVGRRWILCGGCGVEFCFPFFLYFLAVTGSCVGSSIWVEELVWEAFFGCLKFSPIMFDVVCLAET